jgi:hypothetical protein
MLSVAILALACSTAQRGNAQPVAQPVTSSDVAVPLKDQPPYIKLKLGHYVNKQLGIGVVIDLSEVIDNVALPPPGKLRFDGETKVWKLKGRRDHERVDYSNDQGHLMLQSWTDGRRSVFVFDPTTEKWSDEIEVVRDADADPL